MIITLVKADFSANNIGTLSSFNVLTNFGGGLQYNGPLTIERNGSLSASVIVDDNATVKKAVLYMGGQVVTNLTQVGNTISISIPTVTGHVIIEIETDVEVIVPIEPIEYPFIYSGYLKDGEYNELATAGTTDYIDVSHMPKLGIYARMGSPVGYHVLEFYDSNKNYIADLSVNGTGVPAVFNVDMSSDSKYKQATYVRASYAAGSYTDIQHNFYFVVNGYAEVREDSSTGESSGVVMDYFPIDGYIAASTHTTHELGQFAEGNTQHTALRTDFISLDGKTEMNYIGRMGTIGCNYAFYDADKNVIPGLELVGDGTTITKTVNLTDSKYANAAYVVASISKGSISDAEWGKAYFRIV